MDDLNLVRDVLAGDQNAFRHIVHRYQRPLFLFLSRLPLTPPQVDEIAQETFLRAYRSLAGYDAARSGFSSWLFTISKNLAFNEMDRSRHKFEVPTDEREDSRATDARPSAEKALVTHERERGLHRALAHIPNDFRNAIALACLEELSLEQVADIERCSIGTVKSRIFRGKQLLKAFLLKENEHEKL